MGWVSATQYEPEFWGKMPAKPAVIDPIDPDAFRAAPVAEPKVEEPKVEEPKVEEPKAEPKVVQDAAPAVKRVAKKTTPKAKPKTESDDDKE